MPTYANLEQLTVSVSERERVIPHILYGYQTSFRHILHTPSSINPSLISSIQILQPPRRIRRPHTRTRPNKQANRNRIRPVSRVMLVRMRLLRQLRALPRLQHREHDPRDRRADELRQRRVQVQNAQVDARELAGGRRRVVGGEVVEAQCAEVGLELYRVAGEAAVGRAAGGGGAEFVDFDAHVGERGPGGESPGTAAC